MNLSRLALLGTIPLAAGFLGMPAADVGAVTQVAAVHGPFRVQSYMGKCLTYGQIVVDPDPDEAPSPVLLWAPEAPLTAAPVYIDDCIAPGPFDDDVLEPRLQRIVVEEINHRHEVLLRAGDKYIGVAGESVKGAPLELQDYTGLSGQIFALDGDSIVLVYDFSDDPDGVIVSTRRDLVVEVKNARGGNGTPLVLGERDLDDSEFWDFKSVDGSYRAPTNGFVRVPEDMPDIANVTQGFKAALDQAHWGSVIQIGRDARIDLTQFPILTIPGGVTIRGGRRGIESGPLLSSKGGCSETGIGCPGVHHGEFRSFGDFVRITGLQLEGPSRSQSALFGASFGTGLIAETVHGATIVDHSKLSDYPTAAINAASGSVENDWACGGPPGALPPGRVHVVRNFIHHNTLKGLGYGVSVGGDGFAEIVGNTFLMNRHAIAADGMAQTGYRARSNLVLSNVPSYGITRREQADFDMHGSDGSSQHTGGIGGGAVEIAGNTFLGSNRLNYDLRGRPCELNRFVNNVSQQSAPAALRWYVASELPPFCKLELETEGERIVHQPRCGFQTNQFFSSPPAWLEVAGNQFNAANPTDRLGVGDFDGDGRDDIFLATGQAWYFAPGGKVEWRLLSARTDRIASLRFGDFDRDGRTDVLTKHGSAIVVSWGGLSDWEQVNESGDSINDYAIGDFDGDRRSDIFFANGSEWFVSYGAVSAFVPYAVASHRVNDVRFGDFDGDKKTDVFGVVSGQWSIVPGGTDTWMRLRSSLDGNVARLVVADFNGDGHADVVRSIAIAGLWVWQASWSGTGGWTAVHVGQGALYQAPGVGRFNDMPGADALTWGRFNSLALDIVSSATGSAKRWSEQEMK